MHEAPENVTVGDGRDRWSQPVHNLTRRRVESAWFRSGNTPQAGRTTDTETFGARNLSRPMNGVLRHLCRTTLGDTFHGALLTMPAFEGASLHTLELKETGRTLRHLVCLEDRSRMMDPYGTMQVRRMAKELGVSYASLVLRPAHEASGALPLVSAMRTLLTGLLWSSASMKRAPVFNRHRERGMPSIAELDALAYRRYACSLRPGGPTLSDACVLDEMVDDLRSNIAGLPRFERLLAAAGASGPPHPSTQATWMVSKDGASSLFYRGRPYLLIKPAERLFVVNCHVVGIEPITVDIPASCINTGDILAASRGALLGIGRELLRRAAEGGIIATVEADGWDDACGFGIAGATKHPPHTGHHSVGV